ncbi:hypothetical protein G6F65_021532 [Rhizopus arrhizus]|nr:hypothetical protein G6F65_021532 [Rhizopus arrhizus]
MAIGVALDVVGIAGGRLHRRIDGRRNLDLRRRHRGRCGECGNSGEQGRGKQQAATTQGRSRHHRGDSSGRCGETSSRSAPGVHKTLAGGVRRNTVLWSPPQRGHTTRSILEHFPQGVRAHDGNPRTGPFRPACTSARLRWQRVRLERR